MNVRNLSSVKHGYVKVLTVKCTPDRKNVASNSVADNRNINIVMSNYVLL